MQAAERAAADGEVTLAELARAVLGAVNAAAGVGRGGGLSDAISAVMNSFGGARAEGGPVLGGGAGVTVNVSADGGAQGLLRSEAQIARRM